MYTPTKVKSGGGAAGANAAEYRRRRYRQGQGRNEQGSVLCFVRVGIWSCVRDRLQASSLSTGTRQETKARVYERIQSDSMI